jgi:hypothetical protein
VTNALCGPLGERIFAEKRSHTNGIWVVTDPDEDLTRVEKVYLGALVHDTRGRCRWPVLLCVSRYAWRLWD